MKFPRKAFEFRNTYLRTSPRTKNIQRSVRNNVTCSRSYRWKPGKSLHHEPAKIYNFYWRFHVFNDIFYCGLLVCFIRIFYVIMEFSSVLVLAFIIEWSPVFNSRMDLLEVEKMMKFPNFMEIIQSFFLNARDLKTSREKKSKRSDCELDDLLYEFLAETMLTVYRRLGIVEQEYSQWRIIIRRAGIFSMESNTETVTRRVEIFLLGE